jgi:hypothetical protein
MRTYDLTSIKEGYLDTPVTNVDAAKDFHLKNPNLLTVR